MQIGMAKTLAQGVYQNQAAYGPIKAKKKIIFTAKLSQHKHILLVKNVENNTSLTEITMKSSDLLANHKCNMAHSAKHF